MNLERLFNIVQLNQEREIYDDTLIMMIQKRLLRLHDDHSKGEEGELDKRQQVFLETLPYILLLGKKKKIEPWYININISDSFFNQDIGDKINQMYKTLIRILEEDDQQTTYKYLIDQYLSLGLFLGMTPKQIQREYDVNQDRNTPLHFELNNHYIHNNYVSSPLSEL